MQKPRFEIKFISAYSTATSFSDSILHTTKRLEPIKAKAKKEVCKDCGKYCR